MFSAANKITKTTPAVTQKAAGNTFFKKAGEETFFSSKENPSFFGKPVQAKLTVSSPDDPQEKEADAVADKVMRMPEPVMEAVQPGKKEDGLQRKEEEEIQAKPQVSVADTIQCKQELHEKLQTKSDGLLYRSAEENVETKQETGAGNFADNNVDRKNISLHQSDISRQSGRGPPGGSLQFEQTLASSKGGGSALPGDTRTFMESRFNADFSGVRIHTNTTAQNLSRHVNAQAFAHGNDIYFNSGKFSPNSSQGGNLLAHELTHTIQQGASKSNSSSVNDKPISKKNNLHHRATAHLQASLHKITAKKNAETTINNDADAATIYTKEEVEHTGEKPGTPEIIQSKPVLSKATVDAAGALNMASAMPATVIPDKILAKQEEKNEDDDKVASHQPEIQKKQEQPIFKKEAITINPVPAVQTRQDTSSATAAITKNTLIQTKGFNSDTVVALQSRGPPPVKINNDITIQRSVVDDALGYAGSITDCISTDIEEAKRCAKTKAKEVAMHIPGYKALRVVLGQDPITGEPLQQSGRNFIEAAFDIMPGGELLHRKLDELHKLDAAAAWIDAKIGAVTAIVGGIKAAVANFWAGISSTDIFSPLEVLKKGVNIVVGFINSVKDFAVKTATDLLKMVKDFLLDSIVGFIKTETTAYPLLTVILGKDPITEKEVPANGTTILNALLDLGGAEGKEQKKQMQDTGTFAKVAGFIDQGILIFKGSYDEIVAAFHNIWNEVSIENLMDPAGTFNRIYEKFAAPVTRVWAFIKVVGAQILKFIKEVLMNKLSAWAKTVKGYTLITVIIGKDPFTNAEVPRTVENIIHGFMSLMDGGEEQFTQMKESGAIAKAEQKITAAVKQLNMTPQAIVQLFIDLWNSFSISDLANPVAAFQRILAKFGEPIARLLAFVVQVIKIVVEVILTIMQFPIGLVNKIIAKAMEAFDKIKADPIGFLKNLLRAIKEGFMQFFSNILKHLLAGLTGWLMSELKDANVQAPKDFSLSSIIGWVLDLLGISMEKIWQKLAAHPKIGPERVAKIRGMIDKLEGIWTFIKDVQERGMAAIWDKIAEQLNNLWDTVLDTIKNWIMEQIINKIVTKLLSMLDPTGIMAVVNSAIALYSAIQSFIKYIKEMLEIVNSFVEGVVEIANGNTKKAANFLENTLAKGVPVVIGFLANQVGLSGVGKKVGEIIEKIRGMVDMALTWLVNKAVDTGFNLLDKVMGVGNGPGDAAANSPDADNISKLKKTFGMNGESHELSIVNQGGKYQIFMASEFRGRLIDKVDAAQVEIKDKDGKDWDFIKEALKTEKDKLVDIEFDISAILSGGHEKGFTIADINNKMETIANNLQSLGSSFQIKSLQHLGPVSKYVTPVFNLNLAHADFASMSLGDAVRKKLYGDWRSDVQSWKQQRLSANYGTVISTSFGSFGGMNYVKGGAPYFISDMDSIEISPNGTDLGKWKKHKFNK